MDSRARSSGRGRPGRCLVERPNSMALNLIRRAKAKLRRQLDAWTGQNLKREISVGDQTLQLVLGNRTRNMGSEYPPGTVYEPWVRKFLLLAAQYVGEDKSAVDVGANMGIMTLTLAALLPRGKVLAFEPVRVMHDYLVANAKNNGIENVIAEPLALTATANEKLHMNMARHAQAGGSFTSRASNRAKGTYSVPVDSISLDAYLERFETPPDIKILKIDVEGWESATLAGAAGTLAKHDPLTFLEFNVCARSMAVEERGRELFERIRSHFKYIYLINRLDEKLQPIANYAELRASMLTGHFVEDLLCFNDEGFRNRLQAEIQPIRFMTYGAAAIRRDRVGYISCLSQYPDNWCHGHDFALFTTDRAVRLTLENAGPHADNRVIVSRGNETREHFLGKEPVTLDFAPEADREDCFYIYTEKIFSAREQFGNSDPRILGIRIQVETPEAN